MRKRLIIAAVAILSLAFLLGRWTTPKVRREEGQVTASQQLQRAVTRNVDEDLIGPCRVTRVIDRHTVDVDCGAWADRAPLLRIGTPEHGQAGYLEAGDALAWMVQGKDVYLAFEQPGILERGSYGRLLTHLYVDGRNIKVETVRQGWSGFWTKYGTGRFAEEFRAAEGRQVTCRRHE